MEKVIDILTNNSSLYIISMIICLLTLLLFIYKESENIVFGDVPIESIFGIIVLLLVSFLPVINLIVAVLIVAFTIIYIVSFIFSLIKKD